jgi:osmotically-inducible protein OsmY
MMTDLELKKNVESELAWEPSINAAEIGVAAKDGIVTLTGRVASYWQKTTAERAAARVFGVKALVNELEVRLPTSAERTDGDIARAVVNALAWNPSVPNDRISVTVSKGWVTLEGTVEWQYQRTEAANAVRNILGVIGVSNLIEVKPKVSKVEVKAAIEAALKRSAEIDANRITVETDGDKVILRGTVRSWAEREAAERAAWAAPGVRVVDDRITVGTSAAAAA